MEFLLKKITPTAYQALSKGAQTIEQDAYGEKVLRLPDGRYIKLFRTKRLFSSAILFPHALRFKRNADKLKRLGIATLSVEQLFSIPHIKRHGVIYQPLDGCTLREFLKTQHYDDSLWFQLGEFLAQLHQLGIFFRSVHFANIIITPGRQFGLIDVADMQIGRFPLHYFKRLRNFKHFLRVTEDIHLLPKHQVLEEAYLNVSGIHNLWFKRALLNLFSQLKSQV